MFKGCSAIIFLFLLIPVDLSFAQAVTGGVKIYSGYLHQKGQELPYRQCSVEFKSPIPFSNQDAVVLPGQLAYFVRFKNGPPLITGKPIKEKADFKRFIIKIYITDDDQEYSIDPEAEGKQVPINAEHHIDDSYLIYLLLGATIDHLEIVSSPGNDQDKYVLDKLEIHNNH